MITYVNSINFASTIWTLFLLFFVVVIKHAYTNIASLIQWSVGCL